MTKEELQAIRQRCEKATPGNWQDMMIRDETKMECVADETYKLVCHCGSHTHRFKDAEFIAHSRTDIPNLLNYTENLQAENCELRTELEKLIDAVTTEVSLLEIVYDGGAAMSAVHHLQDAIAAANKCMSCAN